MPPSNYSRKPGADVVFELRQSEGRRAANPAGSRQARTRVESIQGRREQKHADNKNSWIIASRGSAVWTFLWQRRRLERGRCSHRENDRETVGRYDPYQPQERLLRHPLRRPANDQQKSGKIIPISSTAGQRGEAFHTHYGASKGGIISLTKRPATELAPP